PQGARLGRARSLGDVHTPDGGRSVRAGLGAPQERLQVPQQVGPIVRAGLSVHARGTVPAGAIAGLDQPGEVQVVVEGGEPQLRRLAAPAPLVVFVCLTGVRVFVSGPCFLPAVPRRGAPSPPPGPRGASPPASSVLWGAPIPARPSRLASHELRGAVPS